MKWLNKILETNLNAVLITILIHLALLFAFLLLQLTPPPQDVEAVVIMDPDNLEEMEKYFEAKEEVEKRMEKIAEAKNISLDDIKNLSTNSKPENNTFESEAERMTAQELKAQYEEELRKEMYGDKYDEVNEKLNEHIDREEYTYTPKKSDNNKKGNQEYYSGPALVKVELEDQKRGHIHVEIPVFICRGSGTVVIGIEIDQYGQVDKTKVLQASESIDIECMINEAKQAAKKSIFAIDMSKKSTKGKITYQFIEQQ